MRTIFLAAAASVALAAVPASAQTSTTTRDRIGQILGNLLGYGNSADSSLDGQWRANRRPLGNQRIEFDARVDADVRSGRMSAATATRLKTDYLALAEMESRYGADGTFTTTEKNELTARYNELIQVLSDGRYSDGLGTARPEVGEGRTAFFARVDAQVAARKITRTTAARLKTDYDALIRVETGYLADGILSDAERNDLDTRLDALDMRVGDVAYTVPVTAETRLADVFRALPASGLTAAARAQLLVEHGDLERLADAYQRTTPTAEEKAYLEQRLANLEARAKVRR